MKKILSRIIVCMICCFIFTYAALASVTSYNVYLSTDETSATSNPVGLGTEAEFWAENYSISTTNMTINCKACWSGYPYTTEATATLKPEQTTTITDTQSKSSNFKLQLKGGKTTCAGRGNVTLIK